MISLSHTFRPLLVGVLALSLTAAPFCPMAMAADCPLSQSKRSLTQCGPATAGRCCCGANCHCANCPATHPQQQQNKKESPIPQTNVRDLAKLVSAVSYSLFAAMEKSGDVAHTPTLIGETAHLQTLISQHTCLRV
jgi:hypothetical protein